MFIYVRRHDDHGKLATSCDELRSLVEGALNQFTEALFRVPRLPGLHKIPI
jgi:hypothetical protein